MIPIKDFSFLILEEIPLDELPQGISEIVRDYRYEGELSAQEAMELIEQEFEAEMISWIQTNQELSQILSEI